jgi:hypothetical protein
MKRQMNTYEERKEGNIQKNKESKRMFATFETIVCKGVTSVYCQNRPEHVATIGTGRRDVLCENRASYGFLYY